jgi:hypothetical protein
MWLIGSRGVFEPLGKILCRERNLGVAAPHELTENTQPIRGGVDSASKRVAWLVGDNTQTVMETGVADLTDPETPALIHKNGKTDHWILVRLDQPK